MTQKEYKSFQYRNSSGNQTTEITIGRQEIETRLYSDGIARVSRLIFKGCFTPDGRTVKSKYTRLCQPDRGQQGYWTQEVDGKFYKGSVLAYYGPEEATMVIPEASPYGCRWEPSCGNGNNKGGH